MPVPHSPTPHDASPNPEQGQGSSKTETRQGPTAFPAGYQRQTCSGFPLSTPPPLPMSSPLPPARAPAFHFPFTVGNLTSPLSAFRLFLRWSPFLPLPSLQPYSRSTDYLFYFCPINSSVMVPGGKPTATKPPAVDTSHTHSPRFVGFPSPLCRHSKPGAAGGGGMCPRPP